MKNSTDGLVKNRSFRDIQSTLSERGVRWVYKLIGLLG